MALEFIDGGFRLKTEKLKIALEEVQGLANNSSLTGLVKGPQDDTDARALTQKMRDVAGFLTSVADGMESQLGPKKSITILNRHDPERK